MDESLEPEPANVPKNVGDFPIAEVDPKEMRIQDWLTWFVACNPFYIISAALLLYGLYLVSIDPRFLGSETANLVFNFSSLQCYEFLVTVTAIFLARRCIWYDSMLLVGLENLLLLVPFILISQAALIDKQHVWAMCLVGGAFAICRFGCLKRFIAGINLPFRLLGIGFAVLVLNVALPVVYRVLHESKFGTKPDWGSAFYTNEYVWLLALPVVCWLADFVPLSRRSAGMLPSQGWLPIGCFALWLVGTVVHLYCLGYVYDFGLRCDLSAPAIWMLCWIIYRRLPEFMPQVAASAARVLLVLPAVTTLLAASRRGHIVFLALTILNATIYQRIYARHRGPRLVLHLLLISLGALVAALPQEWGTTLVTHLTRGELIGVSVAGYLLIWTAFSVDPRRGVLGAIVAGVATDLLMQDHARGLHWATEIGIAFLLLHSLRWADTEHDGAKGIRSLLCLAWVGHAIIWMNVGGSAWMTCVIAAAVFSACLVSRLRNGVWCPRVVLIAALLVASSGPAVLAVCQIQNAPIGVLSIIGSLLLFVLGTLIALTRHRWHNRA